jgi:hypothetical protein
MSGGAASLGSGFALVALLIFLDALLLLLGGEGLPGHLTGGVSGEEVATAGRLLVGWTP